jgi:hypothetical protein
MNMLALRTVSWLVLGSLYLSLTILSLGLFLLIIIPSMLLARTAYKNDQVREQNSTDTFQNQNLFFRYGTPINVTEFPIPANSSWSEKETVEIAQRMNQRVESRSMERLRMKGIAAFGTIDIIDKRLFTDKRSFLKVVYKTIRGSQLSHFVHYAVAGKSIVAHYYTYIRGATKWHDVFNFVFFSPLTIWFWGIPWLKNQCSILSVISRTEANSFDAIDLTTFYESSYYVLLDETRAFLKDNGLLSEEVAQVIFNNISNNNSQNISISRSRNVSLGRISHQASATKA